MNQDRGAYELLMDGLNPFQQLLNRQLIDKLFDDFRVWRARRRHQENQRVRTLPRTWRRKRQQAQRQQSADRRASKNADTRDWCDFYAHAIPRMASQIHDQKRRYADFRQALAKAPTEIARRRLILMFARDLGARASQLRQDEAAFERWFDEGAVVDRYERRRGESEQALEFCFARFGRIGAKVVSWFDQSAEVVAIWSRLQVEALARHGIDHEGDVRVARAAVKCLAAIIASTPSQTRADVVSVELMNQLREIASDHHADTWLQCDAIDALLKVDPQACHDILHTRLCQTDLGDDIFVRSRIVRSLARTLSDAEQQAALLHVVSKDKSAFVRQSLAWTIWKAPREPAQFWMRHLACDDPEPKVRASVLCAAVESIDNHALHIPFIKNLAHVLREEKDEFVCRVALYAAASWLQAFLARNDLDRGQDSARSGGSLAWPAADKTLGLFSELIPPAVQALCLGAEGIRVRREAAMVSERMWLMTTLRAKKLWTALSRMLRTIPPGKSRRIRRASLPQHDPMTLGRVLSVMAQDDYGYDVELRWYGYRITRGSVFGLRAWRVWHEMRHPAPDKRQAFRHTIGRLGFGVVRAPSAILAEMSETKVPGEPLAVSREGGWRPFLPLPDDFVGALGIGVLHPQPIRFYCSCGVTTIQAPASWTARIRAWIQLTRNFAQYATLRNWDEQRSSPADQYLLTMQRLGFQIRFDPHLEGPHRERITPTAKSSKSDAANPAGVPEELRDDSIQQFFPPATMAVVPVALVDLRHFAHDFATYIASIYENSVHELLAALAIFMGLFLLKHWHANWTLRNYRREISLSLGGWGTRGKSGTERLKAALINGMGYSLVSKTTGCEAMFLQGAAYGPVRELPLYRPYDKATIWEHRDVLRMAANYSSAVFLWECMGLTPAYVDVLQRQWTQDDLATITNMYPDHEDVQGPAGWNVASVISEFAPVRSRVITTENEMLPILRTATEKVGSVLRPVSWLESGLLTDEVLNRFPYKEHPDNIALVLAMADELGCDADFAVKAMADEMVPDLGVLKTYPRARLRHRNLEFTNGMSANERFGCMGNWQRMGFADQDPVAEPHVWITTIVNNRADRVPRSRVFASILVNDIEVDRHFLIGGNLKGLQGFIWECWEAFAAKISLDKSSSEAAVATYDKLARQFRQIVDEEQIQRAVFAMIRSAGAIDSELGATPTRAAEYSVAAAGRAPIAALSSPPHSDEHLASRWSQTDEFANDLCDRLPGEGEVTQAILDQVEWMQRSLTEYRAMRKKILNTPPDAMAAIEDKLRSLLKTWFGRKLIVIDNPDASGEQIIQRMADEVPPGFTNRLMGIQNIKGTGLDFVYRWQAWQTCSDACDLLLSQNATVARKGLQMLATLPDLGSLCDEKVRSTINVVRGTPFAQNESVLAELESISSRLRESMEQIMNNRTITTHRPGLFGLLVEKMERFLDVGDAVRRRKKADRIYQDLATERISRDRAVVELREINNRQKGGWLVKQCSPSRKGTPGTRNTNPNQTHSVRPAIHPIVDTASSRASTLQESKT